MKKFLISVIVLLLMILTYFLIIRNITISNWTSKSINNVKELNTNLNTKIDTAKQKNNQEYPQSIEKLESSIKKLKTTKEKYEIKTKYIADSVELGIIQTKEYKIERLWITLANYAEEENVDLKLEILETPAQGIYNMNVTVTGEYINITDFIYDIEKDDTLGFKVLNFKLLPTTTNSNSDNNTKTEEKTTIVNVDKLVATFKIENVGIDFN